MPPSRSPPGAETVTAVPKFEKDDFPPALEVAPTVTTPLQLAGEVLLASRFSLPAATMTTAPFARAALMAFWVVMPQAPPPPRDRLITRAGVAFVGTPATALPAAQVMASATSELYPPQRPSARSGSTLAP